MCLNQSRCRISLSTYISLTYRNPLNIWLLISEMLFSLNFLRATKRQILDSAKNSVVKNMNKDCKFEPLEGLT